MCFMRASRIARATPQLVAEAAEAAARRRRVILFSTIAALGGFLFGYDTAVINGAVGAVQAHYQAGPLALGAAVASALIGSAIGAWFAVTVRWIDAGRCFARAVGFFEDLSAVPHAFRYGREGGS